MYRLTSARPDWIGDRADAHYKQTVTVTQKSLTDPQFSSSTHFLYDKTFDASTPITIINVVTDSRCNRIFNPTPYSLNKHAI